MWTLPWQPWQVAGLPPFILAWTLPWNGVISSTWHSMQDVERHRAERLPLALVLHGECGGMALDAIEALVGAGLELRLDDRHRLPGVVLAISGSSWQPKHFSFGIVSVGGAAASLAAGAVRPQAGGLNGTSRMQQGRDKQGGEGQSRRAAGQKY